MEEWFKLASKAIFSNPSLSKELINRALTCPGNISEESLFEKMKQTFTSNVLLSLIYGLASCFLNTTLEENHWLYLSKKLEESKTFTYAAVIRKIVVNDLKREKQLAAYYDDLSEKQESRKKIIECQLCCIWLSKGSKEYLHNIVKTAKYLLESDLALNCSNLLISVYEEMEYMSYRNKYLNAEYHLLLLESISRRNEKLGV